MRKLAIQIAVLLSIASSVWAAETQIVGKSKTGQHFTFSYGFSVDPSRIADFPRPQNITADPSLMSGVQATAERTANFPEIYSEAQCGMLSTNDALYLSCAVQPKNALSGVVYLYKGINKTGNGVYKCVVGCSNRVPRTLLEVTLESGC